MGRSFTHSSEFRSKSAARELRKHGVRVRLSGQPLAILEMLLDSPAKSSRVNRCAQALG